MLSMRCTLEGIAHFWLQMAYVGWALLQAGFSLYESPAAVLHPQLALLHPYWGPDPSFHPDAGDYWPADAEISA